MGRCLTIPLVVPIGGFYPLIRLGMIVSLGLHGLADSSRSSPY